MDNSFNILVLSDMHYQAGGLYKERFHAVFNGLIDALVKTWKEHPDWLPHCIAMAGDIASVDYAWKSVEPSKEKSDVPLEVCYGEIREMLEVLLSKIRELGRMPCVVCTPGNHDKYLEEVLEGGKVKVVDSIDSKQFEGCFRSGDVEDVVEASRMLSKGFGAYADFASALHGLSVGQGVDGRQTVRTVAGKWMPVPGAWVEGTIGAVNGYMVFPAFKVCIASLNSEIYYCGKAVTSLSRGLVESLEVELMPLRKRGFSIITMMHRSPYKLDWDSMYKPVSDGLSLVDKVVGMSDVIICGHDHRLERRRPDIIESKTPLVQNGYIFEQKDFVNRKPKGRDVLYSVGMLQYNAEAKVLRSRELKCHEREEDGVCDYCWSDNEVQTYYMGFVKGTEDRGGDNEMYAETDEFMHVYIQHGKDTEDILRERLLGEDGQKSCVLICVGADEINGIGVDNFINQISDSEGFVYLAIVADYGADVKGVEYASDSLRAAEEVVKKGLRIHGLHRKTGIVKVLKH